MYKLASLASRTALVAALGALGGCATIVNGTTQDVMLETQPEGAACKVERQGALVASVDPTPGKVKLPRQSDVLTVTCTRDGFEPSKEALTSTFSGATFGNLLLGGLVGVVIDSSSGANNKYPERVSVILTPGTFPSEAARDLYFDGVKQRLSAAADAEVKRLDTSCNSNMRDLCKGEAKQVLEARDKALANLETKRLSARVVPTS
ncbi:MAG: hypothetical protein U1E23_12335 [Reyranellaceae bacterium]